VRSGNDFVLGWGRTSGVGVGPGGYPEIQLFNPLFTSILSLTGLFFAKKIGLKVEYFAGIFCDIGAMRELKSKF
jgi:hypothetical protein